MYKQKLIDLLKSDNEVNLEYKKGYYNFGNKVIFQGTEYLLLFVMAEFQEVFHCLNQKTNKYISIPYNTNTKKEFKIIGLPLSERFIRMYCENKGLEFFFTNDYLLIGKSKIFGTHIQIDNTKDFDNQDDLVYQEIHETLLQLN